MTETAFYILLALTEPRHGYGITKFVAELTENRIKLGSGTVYGTLTKMQKDGLIEIYDDTDKKIVYNITDTGRQVLRTEVQRIKLLYGNAVSQEDKI
ncbi:MAG: PadR family transcriptional regulator [Oscillospiraceae bacterium]|nr:PadR family transcriptional regulator [Oscillospiraceae bacterium]